MESRGHFNVAAYLGIEEGRGWGYDRRPSSALSGETRPGRAARPLHGERADLGQIRETEQSRLRLFRPAW